MPILATLAAALTPAQAESSPSWDSLAQCESSGDWSADTGNGYYGGLQFSASTWAGYGGHQFAAQANLATKDQQITVAGRVAASQGWKAWPVCSKRAGLTGTPSAATVRAEVRPPAPKENPPAPVPRPAPATPAPAPGADVWTALAQCSSGGDWAAHARKGHTGGLAIKTATWTHFGGRQYAAHPYQASRADQITVAERILAGQGWRAWPACASRLGLAGAAPAPSAAAKAAPQAHGVTPQANRVTPPAHRATATPAAAITPAAAMSGTKAVVTLPDGSTVTAPNAVAATAVRAALSQLGIPYRYGAASPGRLLDCSALIQYAYRQAGVTLPRTSSAQATGTRIASPAHLLAGDLIVWNGHVAMYLGQNRMIETGATKVKIVPFRTSNLGMGLRGFFRPTG